MKASVQRNDSIAKLTFLDLVTTIATTKAGGEILAVAGNLHHRVFGERRSLMGALQEENSVKEKRCEKGRLSGDGHVHEGNRKFSRKRTELHRGSASTT